MTTLKVYLLGRFELQYDGQSLPLPPTIKAQSLLAYLILHQEHPQPRDRLAGLFWGDRPERKARRSLTTALWHIRRCLPDQEAILGDSHTVQFDPQTDLWLDVEAFESHGSQDDLADCKSAVSLYRGDFLDGFYDDWIIGERYRLESLFAETLARLMVGYEAKEEPEAAPKRTPLYGVHKEMGAKLVPFAGWEMPVWYTSVGDEHRAVREAAGRIADELETVARSPA